MPKNIGCYLLGSRKFIIECCFIHDMFESGFFSLRQFITQIRQFQKTNTFQSRESRFFGPIYSLPNQRLLNPRSKSILRSNMFVSFKNVSSNQFGKRKIIGVGSFIFLFLFCRNFRLQRFPSLVN